MLRKKNFSDHKAIDTGISCFYLQLKQNFS